MRWNQSDVRGYDLQHDTDESPEDDLVQGEPTSESVACFTRSGLPCEKSTVLLALAEIPSWTKAYQ